MFPRLRKLLTLRRRWTELRDDGQGDYLLEIADTLCEPDFLEEKLRRGETKNGCQLGVPSLGSEQFVLIRVNITKPFRLMLLRRWRTERRWELK